MASETKKTLGLEKDLKFNDINDLIELLSAVEDDYTGTPNTEAVKQIVEEKYGVQNPMNLPKDAPWWEKALHYFPTIVPQRVALNTGYNALQEEDAKKMYTDEAKNKLMPNWDTLPQSEKNVWYKNAANRKVESQNLERSTGIENYRTKNSKELERQAIQSVIDEANKNAEQYDKVVEPSMVAAFNAYTKSDLFNKNVNRKKEQILQEMFGDEKPISDQNYDRKVGTLSGRVNFRDILDRFGKSEAYRDPAVLRELKQAPLSTALDIGADPMVVGGLAVKVGKVVGKAAGIIDKMDTLNNTRKVYQAGNLEKTLANLGPGATVVQDVRKNNPIALRKYAESIKKTAEELTDADIKKFIVEDAKQWSNTGIRKATSDVGKLVTTKIDEMRKPPNPNRMDAGAIPERIASGAVFLGDAAKRSLVYDAIGEQGIKAIRELDPNMTDQAARDLFNKLKEIRQGRGYASKKAVDDVNALTKGSMFQNFQQLSPQKQDDIFNALETWFKDSETGTPVRYFDKNAAPVPDITTELKSKDAAILGKVRNTMDDITDKFRQPRKTMSGEVVGPPIDDENIIANYMPHIHSDYSERLSRQFHGTAREIEALNARKSVAGKLGDTGKIPEELMPGFTLYAGNMKRSITGVEKGDVGFTDARAVGAKTPTLKSIADGWENYSRVMRDEGRAADINAYLDSVFRDPMTKAAKEDYAVMLNDPAKLELMKKTPYTFKDIDGMVEGMAKNNGIDMKAAYDKAAGEYSRDVPLAMAKGVQRMTDRLFMRDALIDLNDEFGDAVVQIVPKDAKNVKIPQGFVKYSDKTFVKSFTGAAKEGNPTLLSTTHDFYVRPEIADMINNYQRNMASEPGFINAVKRLVFGAFGATKSAMTTYKVGGPGFALGNLISSTFQTAATAKNPLGYARSMKGAMSALTGKGSYKIKTPLGTYTSKQIYEEALKRGVVQQTTPESFKAIQSLADQVHTSKLTDIPGTLKNVTDQGPAGVAKFAGKTVARQLSPTRSTLSRTLRAQSDAVESVNRLQAMIMFMERGLPPDMAADAVKKIYIDYSAMAPGAKVLSRTAIPFLSFTKAMAKNVLQNMPMMTKINYIGEGYDRSKPTFGGDPDAVTRETQKDPMGIWASKNKIFSFSRYIMGSGVFGISPDPDEINFGISPVAGAFGAAMTGKKGAPNVPGGQIDIENRDVQFMGKRIKAGDKALGGHAGKVVEFAKLEPHLAMADQILQYLPKKPKQGDLYSKQRGWYEAILPRLRDINNGYNMLVNENYRQGKMFGEFENARDWITGDEGVKRTIERVMMAKVKNEHGPKKDIEYFDNPAATPEEARKAAASLEENMYSMTDKALRMLFLANSVNKRIQEDRSMDDLRREDMMERVESIEKNWSTKLQTIRDTYLDAYFQLKDMGEQK